MPGGHGNFLQLDAATRRAAVAASKAAAKAAFDDVLGSVARNIGKGHAGDGMARKGGAKGKAGGLPRDPGASRGGGGKTDGSPSRYLTWKCRDCGEANNFQRRDNCFRCYAPRGGKGPGMAEGKGKAKGAPKAGARNLADQPPTSLRPHADRHQQGPVGANGSRPLLFLGKYFECKARERDAAATTGTAESNDNGEKLDADGFKVVSRAIGVWPRVGGTDQPAAKTTSAAPATTAPSEGKGAKAKPAPPEPSPAPNTKGGKGKGAGLPSRPPWADVCDFDSDCDVDDDGADDLFDSGPANEEIPQQDDDDMGAADDDLWPTDDADDIDQGVDDDEQEEDPELEALRQRWRNKKDVFEAVAWRFWGGQPQYEDAKSEKDAAFLKWQEARKAYKAPKLANLHQRKQRALDRAKARLERTKQEADEAVRLHEEDMQRRMQQIHDEQKRIDEAEENLRKVMLQVAARTETVAQGRSLPAPNHDEVRDQAAGARKGLQAAHDQLQQLYDQLEEQGNFVACDQINVLYGALAGATGGLDGVERLLARTEQARPQSTAKFFDIDSAAGSKDDGGGALSTTKPAATPTTGGARSAQAAASSAGTTGNDAPETPAHQQPPHTNGPAPHATPAAAAAAGPSATAAGAGSGPAAAAGGTQILRFGGAASDEQEQQLLQAEAESALEQAKAKFHEAERGADTDNAALLFAHQQVLARIGTPTTLEERVAFERWREALGNCLERTAAERRRNAGTYW